MLEKELLKENLKKIEEKEREVERKSWDELTDSEKIERIRKFIKNEYQYINRRLSNLESENRKLRKHQHNQEGKVVIEIIDNYYGSGECEAEESSRLKKVGKIRRK